MSGASFVLLWEDGVGRYYRHAMALKAEGRLGGWKSGGEAWGRRGVMAKVTRPPVVSLYLGEMFDATGAAIIPNDESNLAALYACLGSKEYSAELERVDQALSVTELTFLKVPFDLRLWARRADDDCPAGLPKPFSLNPTQWLFSGHPRSADFPLQVALARLVGYKWPRQRGSSFGDAQPVGLDGLEPYADTDGIVCLPAVSGEESAAARLRTLLQTAMQSEYSLEQLLRGARSNSLEDWLRDEFFEEHCRVFHDRPFVWHVWDGLKDGFHALVNYHKLDRKNLEKLIYSYLGDWLTRQRQDVANGVEGSDARLAAAEHLQSELKKILEGEAPYDVFVRWKPLMEQQIGWEPDLNDGLRMNIRPWIAEARLYKATKPGILRITPNIKYTKDRGKEPARDPKEFPWFKGSTDRINDYHLPLEDKKRARGLV